jgi:arabinose-5-phosphate isomerase
MITDGDLRRHMAPDLLKKTVFEIMNDDPVKIDDDCLMAQGLSLMEEKKITGLFVTKKKTNIPVGFLHIHDCLRLGIT